MKGRIFEVKFGCTKQRLMEFCRQIIINIFVCVHVSYLLIWTKRKEQDCQLLLFAFNLEIMV